MSSQHRYMFCGPVGFSNVLQCPELYLKRLDPHNIWYPTKSVWTKFIKKVLLESFSQGSQSPLFSLKSKILDQKCGFKSILLVQGAKVLSLAQEKNICI